MRVGELKRILSSLPEESEVVVSIFKTNGAIQAFDIDGVDNDSGLVHIEISEAEGLTY